MEIPSTHQCFFSGLESSCDGTEILILMVSTSEVCFIRETASLHCSSVRITSVLDAASLSEVGPPLKDCEERLQFSDDALFL